MPVNSRNHQVLNTKKDMAILTDIIYFDKHAEERDHLDCKIAELEATLLALKRQRNILAPISMLAQELLLSIFGLLQPSEVPSDGRHSIDDLLAASQVCATWRDLATRTPSLWKHILVFDTDATKEIVARSGSFHPLSITIRMDQISESWSRRKKAIIDSSLRLFVAQNSRIEYLELLADSGEDGDGWKDHFIFFTNSLSTHTFEKLHTLIFGCKFDPYGLYIHDSTTCDRELRAETFFQLPSLRVLELYHCRAFEPLPSPGSLANLTVLRLIDPLYYMDVSEAVEFLPRMPRLTTLELVRLFDPNSARRDPEPFSLPLLQQLTIRDQISISLIEFLDAFNPSPSLRVSLYLDGFDASHLMMMLVPFLQKVWTKKVLSVGLSSSSDWDCHLRLHSEPAINPESSVDCTISFVVRKNLGKDANYDAIVRSCWKVIKLLNVSYVDSFSTTIPISATRWLAIASTLPQLSTVIMSYDNDEALNLFTQPSYSNHAYDPNAPLLVPVLPQVHAFIIDLGPGALDIASQSDLVHYARLRDETGSRCKKMIFRTTPLSTEFIKSLRVYVDNVDGIVKDSMYL